MNKIPLIYLELYIKTKVKFVFRQKSWYVSNHCFVKASRSHKSIQIFVQSLLNLLVSSLSRWRVIFGFLLSGFGLVIILIISNLSVWDLIARLDMIILHAGDCQDIVKRIRDMYVFEVILNDKRYLDVLSFNFTNYFINE